jgi:hypothetical protein
LETFTEDAAKGGDDTNSGVLFVILGTPPTLVIILQMRSERDTGDGSEWVYFDDSSSSKTSIESTLNNERSQRNYYLMLFGRI